MIDSRRLGDAIEIEDISMCRLWLEITWDKVKVKAITDWQLIDCLPWQSRAVDGKMTDDNWLFYWDSELLLIYW